MENVSMVWEVTSRTLGESLSEGELLGADGGGRRAAERAQRRAARAARHRLPCGVLKNTEWSHAVSHSHALLPIAAGRGLPTLQGRCSTNVQHAQPVKQG